MPSIERLLVLQKIYDALSRAVDCQIKYPSDYAHALTEAHALVELLEIADCGFIGGYDPEMSIKKYRKYEFLDRYKWLCDKYDQFGCLKQGHRHSWKTITSRLCENKKQSRMK